jgi:hypothetical protein
MTNLMVICVCVHQDLPETTVKLVSEIYTVYKINKAISRFEKKQIFMMLKTNCVKRKKGEPLT